MPDRKRVETLEGWHLLVSGGDHHNTLASMRSLGRAGVPFDLLLHSEAERVDELVVSGTKFGPDSYILVANNFDAVFEGYKKWLTGKDPRKCIVLSSSDLSAYVADSCLSTLGFVTYTFNDKVGRASSLMDKYEQYLWSCGHGIPMARSAAVGNISALPDDLCFPVIIKPIVSAFGEKTDIVIAANRTDCEEALARLLDVGYKKVLVQEVVDFKYEAVAAGCVFKSNGEESHLTLRKEVTYPKKAGNVAIGRTSKDPRVEQLIGQIVAALKTDGYRGMFDIEVFATPRGGVILNEINFRQSGNMFACLDNDMSLPLLWAIDAAGGVVPLPGAVRDRLRIVAEPQLVSGVTHGEISLRSAFVAIRGADSFAFRAKDDNGPFRRFLFGGFARKLKKLLIKKGC